MMDEPVVVVRPCADYGEDTVAAALTAVLEPLGGLDWVQSGMKIGIKTNLITAMKPETAATTHPALLRALTGMLLQRGARVIIGDSPGGVYNRVYVERVYEVCGLKELESMGAELNRDFGQTEKSFPAARVLKHFTAVSWLDSVDAVINFSKLKVHAMMGMTAATKNLFGCIPGSVKAEYHYRFPEYADFADMLVDLNEYYRPHLNLCDAVIGMEGNGPTQGTPKPIGALLASESPYRLDLAAAYLLGMKKDDVPYLDAAFRRGLIPESSRLLRIDGDLDAVKPEQFQLIAGRDSLTQLVSGKSPLHKMIRSIAGDALQSRPTLNTGICVGCGICARSCPAHAIQIVNKKADINRKACIRCFCCQELCPKGAMTVHRPLFARIAGRL